MHIDFHVSLDYARSISRPRQVGTQEERIVAEKISKMLQQFGYSVETEAFQFSTAFERILTAEIFTGLVLVMATILTYGLNRWLTLVLAGFLLALIVLIAPVNRLVQKNSIRIDDQKSVSWWSEFCWKLGRHYSTANIVATSPLVGDDRNIPHLYLVAHYDSKSQYLPLALRIGLFVVVIAGSVVFSILSIVIIFLELSAPALLFTGIIVIICAIPLLFLDYGNDSAGAVDNASGVGLVIHLAEIITKQPALIDKLGITVLITSAEELAVKGALAYLLQNKIRLNRQAEHDGLHFLNFDGIGADGKLYLVGGEQKPSHSSGTDLYSMARQSAQEMGISLGRFFLPGAMFDHIPFAEHGFDAVTLIGIGKDSLAVHTKKDTSDKLHFGGFDQAGRLALSMIEKLSGERIGNSK